MTHVVHLKEVRNRNERGKVAHRTIRKGKRKKRKKEPWKAESESRAGQSLIRGKYFRRVS